MFFFFFFLFLGCFFLFSSFCSLSRSKFQCCPLENALFNGYLPHSLSNQTSIIYLFIFETILLLISLQLISKQNLSCLLFGKSNIILKNNNNIILGSLLTEFRSDNVLIIPLKFVFIAVKKVRGRGERRKEKGKKIWIHFLISLYICIDIYIYVCV